MKWERNSFFSKVFERFVVHLQSDIKSKIIEKLIICKKEKNAPDDKVVFFSHSELQKIKKYKLSGDKLFKVYLVKKVFDGVLMESGESQLEEIKEKKKKIKNFF